MAKSTSRTAPKKAAEKVPTNCAPGSEEYARDMRQGALSYLAREDAREEVAGILLDMARADTTTSKSSTSQPDQPSTTQNSSVAPGTSTTNMQTTESTAALKSKHSSIDAHGATGAGLGLPNHNPKTQAPADASPLLLLAEVAVKLRSRPLADDADAGPEQLREFTNQVESLSKVSNSAPTAASSESSMQPKAGAVAPGVENTAGGAKKGTKNGRKSKSKSKPTGVPNSANVTGSKRKRDEDAFSSTRRVRNKFVAEPTDRVTRSSKADADKVPKNEDDGAPETAEIEDCHPKLTIRLPARPRSAVPGRSSTVDGSSATSNTKTLSPEAAATAGDEEVPLKNRLRGGARYGKGKEAV